MKDCYRVYRTSIGGGKSIAFTREALRPGEKLIHGGLLSLSTQNTISMHLHGSWERLSVGMTNQGVLILILLILLTL